MSVYFVTGATGYIGSMLIKQLLKTRSDAQIIALFRDPGKIQERFPILPDRLKFFQADLYDSGFIERFCAETDKVDNILHCAAVTASSEMIAHPVEVTESLVNTTQNVLKFAKRCKAGSVVYLSSMEVYGCMDCPEERRTTEEEAGEGHVELLRARSSYPLGKRMAENICYSYYKEYGVPVKIARLAQTFGRGILPSDQRVFAQFARAVTSGTDIVLHTEGRSVGNYCAIGDAVAGILTILEHGEDGEAYNVVNEENTMTIRQMAELVAEQIAGGRIRVVYDIPATDCYGYAADTGLRLSGEKLKSLGWRPKKNLVEMYREMLEEFDCKMNKDSLY